MFRAACWMVAYAAGTIVVLAVAVAFVWWLASR
jgi:hypothetical protein